MMLHRRVLDGVGRAEARSQRCRVKDSNERVKEYIEGSLRASGLLSIVTIAPHRDGYRVYVGEDMQRPLMYIDVYFDGEAVRVGSYWDGDLSPEVIGDLARFNGISGKELGGKLVRFRRWVSLVLDMQGKSVDVLRTSRVSDADPYGGRELNIPKVENRVVPKGDNISLRYRLTVALSRAKDAEEAKRIATSMIVGFLNNSAFTVRAVTGADGVEYIEFKGTGVRMVIESAEGDGKVLIYTGGGHYTFALFQLQAWFDLLEDLVKGKK